MSRANGSTRQGILFAIKCYGSLTTEALAQQLGISPVGVRQHLSALQAEGSVTIHVKRRGLGRPSHHYQLTEAGDEQFPRRYADMAADLIEELSAWQGEDTVQALFARKRARELPMLRERLAGKQGAACVEEVARIQSESGHMAHIKEGDEVGEYVLVQHNCAVCSLARRFPQVCCHSEMLMLRELLPSMTVEREQHLLNGDHVCSYRIRVAGAED